MRAPKYLAGTVSPEPGGAVPVSAFPLSLSPTLLPSMTLRLTLLIVLLTFGVAPGAQAQFIGNPQDVVAAGTSYRIFAQPGEDLVRVEVLGDVGSGIYVVGAGTTLSELLALAGGVPVGDRAAQTRQEVTIRLLRQEGGQRRTIYEAEVQEMLSRPDLYPTLQSGDLVTVQTQLHQRYNLRETLWIVSSAASVVLLALRLADSF
jgi:hypothetical protein